jgi:hypothetical protein
MFEDEGITVWGLLYDFNHSERSAGDVLGVREYTPMRLRERALYSNGFPEEILEEMEEPSVVDAGVDGKGGLVS